MSLSSSARPLRLAVARRADGYYSDDEVFFENAVEYMLGAVLDFCRCGRPEESLQYIRDGLAVIKMGRMHTPAERFFAHWADSRGFAEHGIGIGACWLTEQGEELLTDLNHALFPDDA
jgi:hypothetical protein